MNKVVLEHVMSSIVEFNMNLPLQITKMCKSGKLFRIAFSGDEIWNIYLNSFTKEENPIFRDPNSTSKSCNLCKNFIRRYGNIVSIDEEYKITSIFDFISNNEYSTALTNIMKVIKKSKISEVFFETFTDLNELPY